MSRIRVAAQIPATGPNLAPGWFGDWRGVSRSIEKHVFAPTKCIATGNRIDKTLCFRKRT